MFDELDFEADDDIRKPIPAGTTANVQIRAMKDMPLGEFKSGKSEYGPWMVLPFEVVDGEHKGQWASMMLSVKTSDYKFRNIFEVVTGIDVSQGGKVRFEDFRDKLVSGVFEAELGPEVRDKKETGYNRVFKLTERVGDRDVTAESSVQADSQSVDDLDDTDSEDIPF